MSDLSLLNGIIVLLLTSIVGIQLSTVILRRREKTERNELQIAPDDRKPTPHSAAPKRADRPPTDTELSTSPDHHLTERISSVELTATDHSRPRQKRSPLCFRITGVPQDWDKEKLQKALHLENDDLSILPACNHLRKTRTALLRLDSLGWEQKQIIVNEQGRCVRLTIDKNFYGLTALNDPVTPITADIIAITGLAGNAFGSWQHRDSQAMWLYDFLPHYFPSARIMTYGYNSSLLEPNGARLIDHRKSFIEALRNARVDCPERPIIFIGHSLGGILVAQTMLQSFLRGRERISVHGDIYGGIYNLVKGIFFFGTPHRGLNVEDLRDMVALQAEKDEHRQLLDQLDNDSEFLGNQKEACMAMWENFPGRVCSFYETGKTETVVSTGGTFKRGGPKVQKVTRFSALLGIPQEVSVPIISNHSDMVKFADEEGAFGTVVTYMTEWLALTCRATYEAFLESMELADFRSLFKPDEQKRNLEELARTCEHEKDTLFFWIFQNMDYKNWKDKPDQILVLSSAASKAKLKHAAALIIKEVQEPTIPLYVFSAKASKLLTWEGLGAHEPLLANSLCIFLWQLIDRPAFSALEKKKILKTFLHHLLSCRDDSELPKVLMGTAQEKVSRLLNFSTLEDLRNAFEQTIHKEIGVATSKTARNSREPRAATAIHHLIFAFDLDNPTFEAWKNFLESLRKLQGNSLLPFKVLVANPPISSNLGLDCSEILLEYDKERQECLKSLHFENSRYGTISDSNQHTLGWFFDSPEYKDWISSKDSSLLFIEGKPGSGKSTLMRFFKKNFGSTSQKSKIMADFFYSARTGGLHTRHHSMLRSLLFRILEADESSFVHFQSTYRGLNLGSDGLKKWSDEDMRRVLKECGTHKLRSDLILVIDALDESDESERLVILGLLRELARPGSGNCVKVCLASRPIPGAPKDSHSGFQYISLQTKNFQDIKKFTEDFISNLPMDEKTKVSAQEYIIDHADGVFVWVNLIKQDLNNYIHNGSNPAQLMRYLKDLPTDLEEYYKRMLCQLKKNKPTGLEHGKRILQFCLFSHRHITLAELHQALALPGDGVSEFMPRGTEYLRENMSINIRWLIFKSTGNFVEIKSIPGYSGSSRRDIVQVMHQTVREFFVRSHGSVQDQASSFIISEADAHSMFKTTCIQYLRLIREEICHSPERSVPIKDWGDQDYLTLSEYLDTRPFLLYSLEYLAPHKDVVDIVERFLQGGGAPGSWIFNRLLNETLPPDYRSHLNRLLAVAAMKGSLVSVGIVIALGADADHGHQEKTPLHHTAENGHEAVARLLIETFRANKEAQDREKRTSLHLAARNGHEMVVKLLVETFEADQEARDKEEQTPLHLAARHGQEAIVRLLIETFNADKEAKDKVGQTPLHLAARYGQEAIVRLLIETFNADMEAGDNDGRTPLHLAARYGQKAIVWLLIETFNAEKEAEDNDGRRPLHAAIMKGIAIGCKA